MKRFFRENALKLVTCPDMDPSFHTDARKQHEILEDMIHEQFNQVCDLHLDRIILEPSFFCEMLGLQGRMDLLQEDMRVLMEQKSGKREYGTSRHVEKHYVQMYFYIWPFYIIIITCGMMKSPVSFCIPNIRTD